MPLKISSPLQEGNFSVSKWIKHQVLLDFSEMEELCSHLAPVQFFNVSTITPLEQIAISQEQFLAAYRAYIETLQSGKLLQAQPREFSSALARDSGTLYAHEIQPGRYMAKPLKPLIQLQPHRFFHSKTAETIHPMVMGLDSIHWGIQAAYPQIFFEAAKGIYSKVQDTEHFPNTALFTQLVKWLRHHTVPTTFVHEGKKISTPLRLGKRCFSWISSHPQLLEQGLTVHAY